MNRIETAESMLRDRLDWIESQWGAKLACCIAWSYGEGMSLERAEYWHGVGFGIITPYGSDEQLEPADYDIYAKQTPSGVQSLDDAAREEDWREERSEVRDMFLLAHGQY